jgi:hypothetical protein
MLPEATGKLPGSTKKGPGQDLALAHVKRTFFNIEISSVWVG